MSDLTRVTCPVCERRDVPIESGVIEPHRTDLQHDCPASGKPLDYFPKAKPVAHRQRYAVDWSDASFPQIVPIEMHPYLEAHEGKTFADAKRAIIEHFEQVRDHAREMIRKTRALRIADVEAGES